MRFILTMTLLSASMVFGQYPKRVKVDRMVELDSRIPEGSGMVLWNGQFWIHNDSGVPSLFAIDTASFKVISEYRLPAKNTDWEEIAQDSTHFYIGDFGNNFGLRDTVHILVVNKTSLLDGNPEVDRIKFAWPEGNPNCEAMVIIGDSICLFTKEFHRPRRTRMYKIPKFPGTYEARYYSEYKTKVAVTGACFDDRRLVLLGYNRWLKPHLLVFEDFDGNKLSSARKIKIRKCIRQTEGLSRIGNRYVVVSEKFRYWFVKRRPELFFFRIDKH